MYCQYRCILELFVYAEDETGGTADGSINARVWVSISTDDPLHWWLLFIVIV